MTLEDTASTPPPEHQAEAEPCLHSPAPESREGVVQAGAHYLKVPTGGASWDGHLVRFFWSDDRARIVDLRIVVTWDAELGSEQQLRMGVRNLEARSASQHWAHGPFNGASPIDVTITQPNVTAIGEGITIDIGTTTEGPSSVALVDHEVTVTVYQRYRC